MPGTPTPSRTLPIGAPLARAGLNQPSRDTFFALATGRLSGAAIFCDASIAYLERTATLSEAGEQTRKLIERITESIAELDQCAAEIVKLRRIESKQAKRQG